MDEHRRSTDTELALLKQSFEALQRDLYERRVENSARLHAIENDLADIKKDREKIKGMQILVATMGALLLWLITFGQNLLKVFGK